MKLAIVGASGPKWSEAGERAARRAIKELIEAHSVSDGRLEIVSGACHLGGTDRWVAEIGQEMGLKFTAFPPTVHQWSGPGGYRERNMLIAEYVDTVYCIVPDRFPPDPIEESWCAHCEARHIKSGACWTVKYALKLGKPGRVFVVSNG